MSDRATSPWYPRHESRRWQRGHWDGRQAPTSGPFLHHEAEKAKVLYGPKGEVLEPTSPPAPFGFA